MTEIPSSKRLKSGEQWYCVRGKTESKWPYCKLNLEDDDELVYNSYNSSRQECDNSCGRLAEPIQTIVGNYLPREDINVLTTVAKAKNAGFLETKKLDTYLNPKYIKTVLDLLTKPNTANWRYIMKFIERLNDALSEVQKDDDAKMSMNVIEEVLSKVAPILSDKTKRSYYGHVSTLKDLFWTSVQILDNCKFATYLTQIGVLDFLPRYQSPSDSEILNSFWEKLFEHPVTNKWSCWRNLFEIYLDKTKFIDVDIFGFEYISEYFNALASREERAYNSSQLDFLVKFLASDKAYQIGGSIPYLFHVREFEFSNVSPLIQIQIVKILQDLIKRNSIQDQDVKNLIQDLHEKYAHESKNPKLSLVKKQFIQLVLQLFDTINID
jgi:hypothetical protein